MNYYSKNYAIARLRFQESSKECLKQDSLILKVTGPDNESLSIDIAWYGSAKPKRVLLHSSGIHGVEGFAGSAIQLKLLEDLPKIKDDSALILVHVLNPYGMAWLRRTNETNVDLNRNFFPLDSLRTGVTDGYQLLNRLLNPTTPPKADNFYLKMVLMTLKYGLQPVKQAIAVGQYELPNGLFFGGKSLEQSIDLYKNWLSKNLSDIDYLFAIDVHTGLGKWAKEYLLVEPSGNITSQMELSQLLGKKIMSTEQGDTIAYPARGGLNRMINQLFSKSDFVTQEFGTFSEVKVLHAMREENRWHLYGNKDTRHLAKKKLKEVFCPESLSWQETVVNQGVELVKKVIKNMGI